MTLSALVLALALSGSPDTFQQGPERIGDAVSLAGHVIGTRDGCALVMADPPREGWENLGGGGRFYYCAEDLEPGDRVE